MQRAEVIVRATFTVCRTAAISCVPSGSILGAERENFGVFPLKRTLTLLDQGPYYLIYPIFLPKGRISK